MMDKVVLNGVCNNPFFSHHVLLIFFLIFISLRFLNLFYNELIQFMFFKKEDYYVPPGPKVINSILLLIEFCSGSHPAWDQTKI
jgi:hypothetical protein